MKYIAHRGNIDGPKPERENSPAYIELALKAGFYVEVDVWGTLSGFYLGHDRPEYKVTEDFFHTYQWKLFCHCKNVDAISMLEELGCPSYFTHDQDPYTITSNGFIWCYPGKIPPTRNGIIVMPEKFMDIENVPAYCADHHIVGICSDYIDNMKTWVELPTYTLDAMKRVSAAIRTYPEA